MDKAKAREIQAAVGALVASHPEWGVKATKNTASYLSNELRLSVTLTETSTDSEREAFARVAHLFAVKPSAYGTEIAGLGTLVGFATKRPKYPVRIRKNGKDLLYTLSVLSRLTA